MTNIDSPSTPAPSQSKLSPHTEQAELPPEAIELIEALARRQHAAFSGMMRLVTSFGGKVEQGLNALPEPIQSRLTIAVRAALTRSYDLASHSREGPFAGVIKSDGAHRLLAMAAGAAGGAGGLPTALIELPFTTTMIFRAIQSIAENHGYDPTDEQIKLECLNVFAAGSSDSSDSGIDTAFIGARIGLNSATAQGLIARIAPRVAGLFGQKIASQAVPILGAAAGGGTNYAFMDYYSEIAHVRFGLLSLIQAHGEAAVMARFKQELGALESKKLS